MTNQWVFEGCIVERAPVRYTPAGMPIVNCLLHHRSQVTEAGMPRQIEMNIPAVAAGELSGVLERCAFNQTFLFTGFIAPRGRSARAWIFHMTGLESGLSCPLIKHIKKE